MSPGAMSYSFEGWGEGESEDSDADFGLGRPTMGSSWNGAFEDGTGTVGDFARDLMAMEAGCKSLLPKVAPEARAMMLARNPRECFRRADDWFLEGTLTLDGVMPGDSGWDLDRAMRALFCFHVAAMTQGTVGDLYPDLNLQLRDQDTVLEASVGLFSVLSRQRPRAYTGRWFVELCEKIRAVDGFVEGVDEDEDDHEDEHAVVAVQLVANRLFFNSVLGPVPLRPTGSLDLDALPKDVVQPCEGLTGAIVASVTQLPGLVAVQNQQETEVIALKLLEVRRDERGLLLEVCFLCNSHKTFHAPKDPGHMCFEALVEEFGGCSKVTCNESELEALRRELVLNGAEISSACHMQRREAFSLNLQGEEAVIARVLREPMEISFLRLTGSCDQLAVALERKKAGNMAFAQGNWVTALSEYDDALEHLRKCQRAVWSQAAEEEVKVHGNRAECFLRQGSWCEAKEAASQALQDGKNVKALFRRAKAHRELGEFDEAKRDLRAALRVDKANKAAWELLKSLGEDVEQAQEEPVGACPHAGGVPAKASDTAGWAKGLSPSLQHEWLVDCYRMRIDDECVWGASGCYTTNDVKGFLLFCKLAARREVIPRCWNWGAFLRKAWQLLPYAFEKSDAQEKYGAENVFMGALGGRSLRLTAEIVYESSCMFGSEESLTCWTLRREMHQLLPGDEFFNDVGGWPAWAGKLRLKGKGKGSTGPVCCYNLQGRCSYGRRCKFSHGMCGACQFGDRCRVGHGRS